MSNKGSILVVDDDKGMCDMPKDAIELGDYEVCLANDGYRAIEIVKENQFNAVLMDIKMPGINGVETLKELKRIAPDMPGIMLSAFAVEDLIRESLEVGAFAALRKSLDFDLLFNTIEQACGKGGLVLVADDDASTCSMIRDNLEHKGYVVDVVNDGEQTVGKIREARYDAIILDLKMPVMNGLQAYIAIRKIRPDAFVILLSGYAEELRDSAEKNTQGGFIPLVKPVDFDNLFLILGEVMQREKGA